MTYEKAKELFASYDLSLTNVQYEKFIQYKDLLITWNEKINLTNIVEDEDVWIKHFLDSCSIYKYINEYKECVSNDIKLIDIGTGAGFPGIPIKILDENIYLSLLDSLNKRITFLKDLCSQLSLNDIEFIHGRSEDFGQNVKYREKFDIVVSRAVANLATLSEYCIPFLKKNGIFICMKSNSIEDEIENAKEAIKVLGAEITSINEFDLCGNGRSIIIIKKIKNTPMMYPRSAGIPSKKPII